MSATRSPSSSPIRASRRATPPSKSPWRTGRCRPWSMRRRRSRRDAPLLWDEAPGNLSYRFERGDKAAVEAAFAGAAHVVEIELVNNRLVVAPIEPRAAIGSYDAGARPSRIAADRPRRAQPAQPARHGGVPHAAGADRRACARCRRRVRGQELPLSGMGAGAVGGAAARPAGQLGRRARRGFRQLRAGPRQPHPGAPRARPRTGGFSRSTSRRSPISAPICRPTVRAARPTRRPARWAGSTTIPAVFMSVRGAFTNTVPIDAYRGAGKPEANYLIERLVDRAARQSAARPDRAAPAQPDRPISRIAAGSG